MKCLFLLLSCGLAAAAQPCRIEIVDKENGWPVPLVELRTTHDVRFVSDNAGLIAIDDADLLDRSVWFHVKGHGYGVAKDGFGFEGVNTAIVSGATVKIEVERRNIAKRLGRLTGGGLFAEGEKLGIKSPVPESEVFGCDSVLVSPRGNRLFWLWGDTTLPGYPLGIFDSSAATTELHPIEKFEPPIALHFEHYHDQKGKPRGVAKMEGAGPTWLTGITYIGPKEAPVFLVGTYSKIEGHLDESEVGLCEWDEASGSFHRGKILWKKGEGEKPLLLKGHPVRWQDPQGQKWILFGDPFPSAKCFDTYASWSDPKTWQKIEQPAAPRSAADGSEVKPHRGSIAWNPSRKRWVTIFTQNLGNPSAFGEIWYAEADSPMGPWGPAVKVLTHDNCTFYNPLIHAELTPEDASFIVFEGTYTAEFADHAQPTPRYNYNQILYRLDLDDPKLAGARK